MDLIKLINYSAVFNYNAILWLNFNLNKVIDRRGLVKILWINQINNKKQLLIYNHVQGKEAKWTKKKVNVSRLNWIKH